MMFFQNMGLILMIIVFVNEWRQGNKINESYGISFMGIVSFLFAYLNAFFYFGLIQTMTFFGVIHRMSSVFEMEEYAFVRNFKSVTRDEVKVSFENADFTWGFKVKQATANPAPTQVKAEIEIQSKAVLQNLNIDLKSGDLLTVIG